MNQQSTKDVQLRQLAIVGTVFGWWALLYYADHFPLTIRACVIAISTLMMFSILTRISGQSNKHRVTAAGILTVLFFVALLIVVPVLGEGTTDLLLILGVALFGFVYRDVLPRNSWGVLATALCGCLIYYFGNIGLVPFGRSIGWSLFGAAGVIFLLRAFIRRWNDDNAVGP